jgi:hypothetical protein
VLLTKATNFSTCVPNFQGEKYKSKKGNTFYITLFVEKMEPSKNKVRVNSIQIHGQLEGIVINESFSYNLVAQHHVCMHNR